MAHVQYTGSSDRRELSAADWKTLGVEDASKTVFERGEAYDVEDNVLSILLELGDFKELSDSQVEKLLGNSAETDSTEPTNTSSKQTGIDAATTGTTTTTTGRGSRGGRGSTAGSTAT